MGKDLYVSACAICHEGERRAEIVPDLRAIKHETNAEFWRNWIANGREGSLMPAFSHEHGGPLTDAQMTSLVEYLLRAIPPLSSSAVAPSRANTQ
jgi:mono/diheme cytochrome c family protein